MGGQDKLTQLIDPERTGTWDAETAEIARQDACNQILASADILVEFFELRRAVEIFTHHDEFDVFVGERTVSVRSEIVLESHLHTVLVDLDPRISEDR
jgi:hypothetical protein